MRDTAVALFRPFPLGARGLYAAQMQFDAPGDWGLDIAVLDENANTLRANLRFDVPEQTAAPANGTTPPLSDSKTIATYGIEELTTGTLQDADLYQVSIADAVRSGMPTVIVMASPAFCTNAVCGPQVDVLSELKDKHKDSAHFIHIDFFDNPHEIQGDLTRARVSPTVLEWNLPSTEWSLHHQFRRHHPPTLRRLRPHRRTRRRPAGSPRLNRPDSHSPPSFRHSTPSFRHSRTYFSSFSAFVSPFPHILLVIPASPFPSFLRKQESSATKSALDLNYPRHIVD